MKIFSKIWAAIKDLWALLSWSAIKDFWALLKIKYSEFDNKTKFKVKAAGVFIIAIILVILMLFLVIPSSNSAASINDKSGSTKKELVVNNANKVVEPAEQENNLPMIAKPEPILDPKPRIVKGLETAQEANKKILSELKATSENQATKEDIKLILDQLVELNKNNQEKINELEETYVKSVQTMNQNLMSQIEHLEKEVKITINDNPVEVANDDFTLSSIVWLNGNQIVNIHVKNIDQNRSLNLGQKYGEWQLARIEDKCAIFKNKLGVNKQCL